MKTRQFWMIVGLAVPVMVMTAALGASLAGGQEGFDESSLSESERQARHLKLKAEDVAAQRSFLADFVRTGEDPTKLEVHAYEAERGGPRASMAIATAEADMIVHGRVESQRYEIDETGAVYTVSTLRVIESMKGDPPGEFEVRQPGGPRKEGDHVHLIVSDVNPPMFPGDELVVFATVHRLGIFLQAYTGQYNVLDGRIEPHEENAFASSVRGKTPLEFKDIVRASISGPPER